MSIEFRDCTKKFKEKTILNNVNFSIYKGLYHLVGRNGAGKSTILKMIAGLDKKYFGQINVRGNSILYLNVDPIGIYPFTIRENLEILWNTFDIKLSEEQYYNVDEFFDGNLDISYSKASTGMKAKIGLSLILVKDWEIILIDEAMSTIDSESIKVLSERLITLAKKSTIIYVSHSMINKELNDNSSVIYIEKGELSWKNIQS